MELRSRFDNTLRHWTSDSEEINRRWDELFKNYTQKFRAYHNLTHLDEIFHYFDSYCMEMDEPNEVAYAIFYHDIIYSIWKKDNEEKSADMAIAHLESYNAPKKNIQNIQTHILATKSHNATRKDTQWMVDFDLAILGQSWDIYAAYSKHIRKEYQKVPSMLYYPGRKKVLAHFLAKNKIYTTQTFQDMYESQARKNLATELESISKR